MDDQQDSGRPTGIVGVMDQLESETEGEEKVGVEDVLDAFGGRVFGPIIMVPSLVIFTPLGGIPFVPTTIGLLVATIAAQRIFGRQHPWIPKLIRKREVQRDRLVEGMHKVRGVAGFVDRLLRERLGAVVEGPMERVIGVVVVALGLMMIPLEATPFLAVVPATAIVALALAMTAKDGLLGVIGLTVSAAAFGGAVWVFVPTGESTQSAALAACPVGRATNRRPEFAAS